MNIALQMRADFTLSSGSDSNKLGSHTIFPLMANLRPLKLSLQLSNSHSPQWWWHCVFLLTSIDLYNQYPLDFSFTRTFVAFLNIHYYICLVFPLGAEFYFSSHNHFMIHFWSDFTYLPVPICTCNGHCSPCMCKYMCVCACVCAWGGGKEETKTK